MRVRGWIGCTVALVLPLAVSGSQQTDSFGRQAGRIPIAMRTYVGLNPLLIPFDVGSLELESGVAQGVTLGGIASYTDVDGDRWTSGDLKLRYYPGEVVLRGFSVGLSGGFLRYSAERGASGQRETIEAPTIGVVTDFNWMLGSNKRFVVGTGLGAKRVLAGRDKRDLVGLSRAYVTGRFIVGLAF